MILDPQSALPRSALCPKGFARGGSRNQLVAWPLWALLSSGAQSGGTWRGSGQSWSALALENRPRWLCWHLVGQSNKIFLGLQPKRAFWEGPREEMLWPCLPQACCWELQFFKWAGCSDCSSQQLPFITVEASTVSNHFRYFLFWSCGRA